MWREGDLYRKKHSISGPIKHKVGIYNIENETSPVSVKQNDNVTRISHRVDTMKINDLDEANCNNAEPEKKVRTQMTQGDKLIKIKAQRRPTRPVLMGSIM